MEIRLVNSFVVRLFICWHYNWFYLFFFCAHVSYHVCVHSVVDQSFLFSVVAVPQVLCEASFFADPERGGLEALQVSCL